MPQAAELSLADRIAIQDLFARYGWALDTGDGDSLVSCFTTDCTVIEEVFEDPDRWEGHDGVRRLGAHYWSSPGFPGRQHHVTQSLVEGNGERCSVKSFAFVTECRGEPPFAFHGVLRRPAGEDRRPMAVSGKNHPALGRSGVGAVSGARNARGTQAPP